MKYGGKLMLSFWRFTDCPRSFPRHELYGLTSQLRRAAISIPANFAEGFGKATKPDKLRLYSIAGILGGMPLLPYFLSLIWVMATPYTYGRNSKK